MNLFRDIQAFLQWRKDCADQNPYELDEADIDNLEGLSFTKEWDFYTKLLDNDIHIQAEKLLTVQPEYVERTRGFISGLRRAGTIIDQLLTEQEQKNARRRQREHSAEREQSHRRAVTYGSPFWDTSDTF
jgi:hypothetical protein